MANRYTPSDISQFIGSDAAKRAGKGFQQGFSTASANTRSADRLAAGAEQGKLDRASAEKRAETMAGQRSGRETRLGTQALMRDLTKSTGDVDEYYDAVKSMQDLMKSGSPYTIGQIQTGLARLAGEKGPLAEGDIKRALKRTLKQDVTGMASYLGLADEPGLTEDQQSAVQNILKTAQDRLGKRVSGARESVGARASLYGLSPEQAQQATESYGSQYKVDPTGQVEPPYGPTVERNGKTYQWNPQTAKYDPVK